MADGFSILALVFLILALSGFLMQTSDSFGFADITFADGRAGLVKISL